MLFHQPSPDTGPDKPIQSRELAVCAGAEAIVVSPSPQDWIELLEKTRQRPARCAATGLLFYHVPKVRPLAFGNFDPRHVAELGVPFVAHSVTQELKALGQIDNVSLLDR